MKSPKQIQRKVYRNTSEIAKCDVCGWTSQRAKDAREHCSKTGHMTAAACETNIVYYYLKV